MKYAIAFAMIAILMTLAAWQNGGANFVLLWPACSFALLAVGYATRSTWIFSKRADGTFARWNLLLLLPYLTLVWLLWHLIRLTSRDPSSQVLLPGIRIGRRELPRELDPSVTLIVDLTCELLEPKQNRVRCEYWAFPILDASIPSEHQARLWATAIANYRGTVLIHCAQGHGRTGTVAALVLLLNGTVKTAEEAIKLLQQVRPKLRLNSLQTEFVYNMATRIPQPFGGNCTTIGTSNHAP